MPYSKHQGKAIKFNNLILEFALNNNGKARLEYTLDVANTTQMKMVIGHSGRNIKELISKVSVELVKLYGKEFNIEIKVIKRDSSLEELNQQTREIFPKDYGKEEMLRKIEEQKKKRRAIAKALLGETGI
jgi:hypothetical protein